MTVIFAVLLLFHVFHQGSSKSSSSFSKGTPAVSGTTQNTYRRERKHQPAKKRKAPQLSMLVRIEGKPLLTPKKNNQ